MTAQLVKLSGILNLRKIRQLLVEWNECSRRTTTPMRAGGDCQQAQQQKEPSRHVSRGVKTAPCENSHSGEINNRYCASVIVTVTGR